MASCDKALVCRSLLAAILLQVLRVADASRTMHMTAAKAKPTLARRIPLLKPNQYDDSLPLDEIQYLWLQARSEAEPLPVAQESLRFLQGPAQARRGARREAHDGHICGRAGSDPGSALRGHVRLPPLQQWLHSAQADAFQAKFDRREGIPEKVAKLVRQLFITLQHDISGAVALGTTETGLVYQLKGRAVERHE